MAKSKKIIIVFLVILLFLLILLGTTYAYFSAIISGNESSSTVGLDSGTLTITVNGGSDITSSGIVPQVEEFATKTITITSINTGNVTMPYTLNLVIDNNTFTDNAITYTLESTNTSGNGYIAASLPSQTGISNGTSTIALGTGSFSKGSNLVHTYILKIFYPETGIDQSVDQNKSFGAHVTISAGIAGVYLADKILGVDNANVGSVLTTPGRTVSTSEEAVLASAPDDYGVSYYYRGNVQNNYLVFANMCWRIVRITGNGAIKLVLYNYNPSSVVNPCDVSQDGTSNAFARYSGEDFITAYNPASTDNKYMGFMYGDTSTSYATAHANINKSTILTNLETWYASKLSSYENKLADTIWCNDKKLETVFPIGGQTGFGSTGSRYSAFGRIYGNNAPETNASPSLICPNDTNNGKLSKFTVSDTVNGNDTLTYKIGLLTADEMAFAGGVYGQNNTAFYLLNNATSNSWHSLTPFLIDGGGARNIIMSKLLGTMSNVNLDAVYAALRPAISLVPLTVASGAGTSANPYYAAD